MQFLPSSRPDKGGLGWVGETRTDSYLFHAGSTRLLLAVAKRASALLRFGIRRALPLHVFFHFAAGQLETVFCNFQGDLGEAILPCKIFDALFALVAHEAFGHAHQAGECGGLPVDF